MKKIIFLIILIFSFIVDLSAQYYTNQNKVWAFGVNAGVDFTSGSPVAIATRINTQEGSASVCDSLGSLLFYTDGVTVYNRLNVAMPSGALIVPFMTISSLQGALIAPVIGTPNRYYVFSLENVSGSGGFCHLAYSIVDMSLAGGFGDLVSGSIGLPLAIGMSEKMTAIEGNNCDMWVLTHRKDSAVFWAYNITSAGISAPVVSSVGWLSGPGRHEIGMLKASPNRLKVVSETVTSGYGTELFDFDPGTGIVSNCRVLDSFSMQSGAAFSPDNTKLYVEKTGLNISQYDVSLSTTPAIIASKTVVEFGNYSGDMKLAPDGKIYIALYPVDYLDCISAPNSSVAACGYVSRAVTLSTGTHNYLCLPNLYVSPGNTTYTHHDTAACIPLGGITIYAHDPTTPHTWYDGDTAYFHHISTYGNYWVHEGEGCHGLIDTIRVSMKYDTGYTHQDTSACVRSDVDNCTLTAPSGTDYIWYNGNTAATNMVHAGGSYWVGYSVGCVFTFDTFRVTFNNYPGPIVGPDTICIGNPASYAVALLGGTWASSGTVATVGASDGIVTGIAPGIATISYSGTNGCTDTKNVTVLAPPCTNGVTEIQYSNTLDIYPNPANDEFTVSYSGYIYPGAKISIYDMTGRPLHSYPLTRSNTTISIAGMPLGAYQCRIDLDGKKIENRKLVVIR